MAWQVMPRWHKGTGRWSARIGPIGADGKAKRVYFPEIKKGDRAGAVKAMLAYLRKRKRKQPSSRGAE